MKLFIVRPLDEEAKKSTKQIADLLQSVSEGTDYRWVILPGRVDFEETTIENLEYLIKELKEALGREVSQK